MYFYFIALLLADGCACHDCFLPERSLEEKGAGGALLKILRRVQPTHFLIIFDGQHENIRSEIDIEYKANRIDYTFDSDFFNPEGR